MLSALLALPESKEKKDQLVLKAMLVQQDLPVLVALSERQVLLVCLVLWVLLDQRVKLVLLEQLE